MGNNLKISKKAGSLKINIIENYLNWSKKKQRYKVTFRNQRDIATHLHTLKGQSRNKYSFMPINSVKMKWTNASKDSNHQK